MKREALVFKAFSDEIRLRILALLAREELCVAELMAALALPQSTVSRHLATLRQAGLVEDQRQGVYVRYRLLPQGNTLERDLIFLVEKRLAALDQAQIDRGRLQIYRQR